LAARRRRFGYVQQLDEMLNEDGVVLSPTVASPGWLAEGRLTTSDQVGALPGEVYNTSVQNTTGHPALSLPAGRLPNGLPFGLPGVDTRGKGRKHDQLGRAVHPPAIHPRSCRDGRRRGGDGIGGQPARGVRWLVAHDGDPGRGGTEPQPRPRDPRGGDGRVRDR